MATRSAQEQFDRQAKHYNAQWNQWSEESLRWLLEHADAQPHHRVLDVATGTGFTALAFAPLVTEVVGIDVSEGMLTQARLNAGQAKATNIQFQKASAESLPFPDASFDLVTCRVAPHHFLSVSSFAAEAFRVLREGGKLLIADTAVPDGQPEVGAWQNRVELLRDPSHICNYTPNEWTKFLTDAGFAMQEIALAQEPKPITLLSWLEKGGCQGEAAEEVRRSFASPPEAAREIFAISTLPDGDIAFHWSRVVLVAIKPR
jgi:ubiquinone/menaquinone biosynthesis C-methylase UbiE